MSMHVFRAAAAVAVLAVGGAASADIINIAADMGNSEHGLGNFSGTIEYNFLSGDSGQLIISLTNTSEPSNGGFITALLFNIGAPQRSGTDTASLVFSTYPDFVTIAGPGISGAPYGLFDAGAGLGGTFQGGGSPQGGIPVGQTGILEFLIDSPFASVLSASSFISGPNEFNFLVRFRGFEDGGSDKVPVPVPGSVFLLGLGAIAVSSRRRRAC